MKPRTLLEMADECERVVSALPASLRLNSRNRAEARLLRAAHMALEHCASMAGWADDETASALEAYRAALRGEEEGK